MNEVSGWIFTENLDKVVEYIAFLARHDWDDLDAGALEAGLPKTDEDRDEWYEHPVGALTLRLALMDDRGHVSVRISGDFDEVFAARLDTVLDLH
ncbi:hypothetical protein LFM09_39070 [Lentzea alba]|uniref:hypothetical protein n=1 Tax=Lentzea alba TaxID=2714351 RepID=UPI0039BFD7F5